MPKEVERSRKRQIPQQRSTLFLWMLLLLLVAGIWAVSMGPLSYLVGKPTAPIVGADKDTVGIFMNGRFLLANSNSAADPDLNFTFTRGRDVPVAGDWDGDGFTTIGVYLPDSRRTNIHLKNSNSPGAADMSFFFGGGENKIMVGDWDGDGVDTIGMYNPSTSTFSLKNANSDGPADMTFIYGNPNDTPVAGDWDGDGIDTIGVKRENIFYLRNSNSEGAADITLAYGNVDDLPVIGDWDGDYTDTIGIYTLSDGTFRLRSSNTEQFTELAFSFGNVNPDNIPIIGDWDGLPVCTDIDNDGYTNCANDCEEDDAAVNPGANEVCNDIDDNCNDAIDEGFDNDNDGFKTCEGDCDDNNAAIKPESVEVCNNLDDNCDGDIDEGFDADNDGFSTCENDCNDTDANMNPSAAETCDILDNNCNSAIDEGLGTTECGVGACWSIVENCVNGNLQTCSPGTPTADVCENGIDEDCDGEADESADCACLDKDSDGFTTCQNDCDDNSAAIHPGAQEACDNIDNDCDNVIDTVEDEDGDGYLSCNPHVLLLNFDEGFFGITGASILDITGAATFTDTSGYDNEVSCEEPFCPTSATGIVGNALDFDGINDYLETGNMNFSANFTVSAMIYPRTQLSYEGVVISQGASNWAPRHLVRMIVYEDSRLLCQSYTDPEHGGFPGAVTATSSNTINLNSWNFAACSFYYNKSGGRTYATAILNGVETEKNESGQMINADKNMPLLIGAQNHMGLPYTNFFNGTIDEVRVFDRHLASQQFVNDCNDLSEFSYPTAAEACDGIDNNCDGVVDDGDVCLAEYYCDSDADSYFSSAPSGTCNGFNCAPSGCVTAKGNDCNDNDSAVHPGAAEACNNKDDDCDGKIDIAEDKDSDGFYSCSPSLLSMDMEDYSDSSGYNQDVSCQETGCPAATAGITGNALDFDSINDYFTTSYPLIRNTSFSVSAWIKPRTQIPYEGMIAMQGATNQNPFSYFRMLVYIDSALICQSNSEPGYTGDGGVSVLSVNRFSLNQWSHVACTFDYDASAGRSYVTAYLNGIATSKNLSGVRIYLDQSRPFLIGAQNHMGMPYIRYFNGTMDEFRVYDRVLSANEVSQMFSRGQMIDCDDENSNANPISAEICDGADNNCNGQIDEEDICTGSYYCDADGDGYINSVQSGTCTGPGCTPIGCVNIQGDDCNDDNAAVNLGATEICDLQDNDCDGLVDESTDDDGDGFTLCQKDCDDSNAAVNPGAAEICDGMDNNCDGSIDEGAFDCCADNDGDGFCLSYAPSESVLELKLDEPEGSSVFADSSGAGTDVTCDALSENCPVAGEAGVAGSAVKFDGIDDFVSNYIAIDLEQGFTLSFWMRSTQENYVDEFITLKNDSLVFLGKADGRVYYYDFDSEPAPSEIGDILYDWNWHHVAYTFDGSTKRLYVDGKEVHSAPASLHFASSSPFLFGSDSGRSTFWGFIDEVEIYNKVLNPEQIFSDCDDGSAETGPGADEICGDGINNDCDAETDEDDCKPFVCTDDDEDGFCQEAVPSGTVLVMDMEEAAPYSDTSGYGNDGTCTGDSCPAVGEGTTGTALLFDGINDYLNLGNDASLNFGTESFTIDVKVNTEASLQDVIGDILSKFDGAGKKGFNFNIVNNPGGGSQANFRHASFGMDNNRPWNAWVQRSGSISFDGMAYVPKLAVYNGKLYEAISRTGKLYEWDGANWLERASLGAEGITSLAVYNGKLYGGSSAGKLVEWNNEDSWMTRASVGSSINALSVYNGKLYAGSSGKLYEWNGVDSLLEKGSVYGNTIYSLAAYNGKLYAGTGTGSVSGSGGGLYEWDGLNALNQKAPKLDSDTNYIFSLVVYNGKLYAGTGYGGRLYEWNGANGWIRKAPKLGAEIFINSLAVYNGKLYGGTATSGKLYEWDGVGSWIERAPKLGDQTYIYSLAVFNGNYQGKLYAATGYKGMLYEWNTGRAVTYSRELPSGWHRLTVVKDNLDGTIKLYADGVRVATSEAFISSNFDLSNAQDMLVGFGSQDYFNGRIDELRVYKKPLSPPEMFADCDDDDAEAYPGRPEWCGDGVDNNCNGEVDEVVLSTFYQDSDGDGYGDANVAQESCSVPFGFVTNSNECNDANSNIYPGALEICDGIDNNCDAQIDEASTNCDSDEICRSGECVLKYCGSCDSCDTFWGFAECTYYSCMQCSGICYFDPGIGEDCKSCPTPANSCVDYNNQQACLTDRCRTGNNCKWDEPSASCCNDKDNDGICAEFGDCGDNDDGVYPGAYERCDGVDNDCDGVVDDSEDADGDGYKRCEGDCIDFEATVNPSASEICDNGWDDDCDGQYSENCCSNDDLDGDGYNECQFDCEETNPSINPGAVDICDGIDNNCDTLIDELFDMDYDGFTTCGGDCNDSNVNANPYVKEVCDGADNDCNATSDELVDYDGDGVTICGGDCDDTDNTVYPGANETCDGKNNDCYYGIDEWFDTDRDEYTICGGDCDDTNSSIHQYADERCNSVDDDCDGEVDERCDYKAINSSEYYSIKIHWKSQGDADDIEVLNVTIETSDSPLIFGRGVGPYSIQLNDSDGNLLDVIRFRLPKGIISYTTTDWGLTEYRVELDEGNFTFAIPKTDKIANVTIVSYDKGLIVPVHLPKEPSLSSQEVTGAYILQDPKHKCLWEGCGCPYNLLPNLKPDEKGHFGVELCSGYATEEDWKKLDTIWGQLRQNFPELVYNNLKTVHLIDMSLPKLVDAEGEEIFNPAREMNYACRTTDGCYKGNNEFFANPNLKGGVGQFGFTVAHELSHRFHEDMRWVRGVTGIFVDDEMDGLVSYLNDKRAKKWNCKFDPSGLIREWENIASHQPECPSILHPFTKNPLIECGGVFPWKGDMLCHPLVSPNCDNPVNTRPQWGVGVIRSYGEANKWERFGTLYEGMYLSIYKSPVEWQYLETEGLKGIFSKFRVSRKNEFENQHCFNHPKDCDVSGLRQDVELFAQNCLIEDKDHGSPPEGIPDYADNCPPEKCPADVSYCYNPDQLDRNNVDDDDNVGDKCECSQEQRAECQRKVDSGECGVSVTSYSVCNLEFYYDGDVKHYRYDLCSRKTNKPYPVCLAGKCYAQYSCGKRAQNYIGKYYDVTEKRRIFPCNHPNIKDEKCLFCSLHYGSYRREDGWDDSDFPGWYSLSPYYSFSYKTYDVCRYPKSKINCAFEPGTSCPQGYEPAVYGLNSPCGPSLGGCIRSYD